MQASFRKGNDLDEKFIRFSRFFLARKKPDTTTFTRPILGKETLAALTIPHSHPRYLRGNFIHLIPRIHYVLASSWACEILHYSSVQDQKLMTVWSMIRECANTKAMSLPFIQRRKRERRCVKTFSQSSFTRFSVLNSTIVATMGENLQITL